MTARRLLALAGFAAALATARAAAAAPDAPEPVDENGVRLRLLDPTRPYDAPAGGKSKPLPPIPAEYLPHEGDGIRFAYAPRVHERVRPLLARATAIRTELGVLLGRPVLAQVEVRIAGGPAEMSALSPVSLPAYATAVALAEHRLALISAGTPLSSEPTDIEQLLRHTFAHLALDEVTQREDAKAARPLPRWLHEGFAIEFSGEARAARAEALFTAAMRDQLLALSSMDAAFLDGPAVSSLASAEAADFARFLSEPKDRPRLAALVARAHDGEAFDAALVAACDADLGRIEVAFRKDIARRYAFVPVLLAGALLWLAIAAVVVVRRLRGRAAAARRMRRIASREARAARTASVAKTRSRSPLERMPPDPEVPKVEHDGRWYTLH